MASISLDGLERIIDLAAAKGVPLQIVVQVNAADTSPPAPKREQKAPGGLSHAGAIALAAIANGSVDDECLRSLRSLTMALRLPRNALYRDAVFREMYDRYQETGRMPRAKGVWDDRTGSFDAFNSDDADDDI